MIMCTGRFSHRKNGYNFWDLCDNDNKPLGQWINNDAPTDQVCRFKLEPQDQFAVWDKEERKVRDINKFFGIGRISSGLHSEPDGVCTFRVSMVRIVNKKEEVATIRVRTEGKLGEACISYLKKGSRVAVLGYLENFGHPNDVRHKIKAESVQFLDHPQKTEKPVDVIAHEESRGEGKDFG